MAALKIAVCDLLRCAIVDMGLQDEGARNDPILGYPAIGARTQD
jgi:hypothetical protein